MADGHSGTTNPAMETARVGLRLLRTLQIGLMSMSTATLGTKQARNGKGGESVAMNHPGRTRTKRSGFSRTSGEGHTTLDGDAVVSDVLEPLVERIFATIHEQGRRSQRGCVVSGAAPRHMRSSAAAPSPMCTDRLLQ